ncbi:MAG: lysine--tRNA ligase [Candidatus Lightella neohaematopini]|nr:lysine--tRNA ligase [Candidatus Lightella neohaematopini]
MKELEYSIRKNKLRNLKNKYKIVFPNNFKHDTYSIFLHKCFFNKTRNELEKLSISVKITGRIINKRVMGKASFIVVKDTKGKIQIYVAYSNISHEQYKLFKDFDLGDIIGVEGTVFKTNSGELSIKCKNIILLTKAIRPLPNKFHGLSSKDKCYRQRYLELITNDKTYKLFYTRSLIITKIRDFMIKHGFIEVETPIMQSSSGGAIAKPFVTYHNKLHTKMYLRIAPELYLKQLIIGGFEKIFEIGKNFRNEGISPYHNPEFTMLELYIAYANYNDLIILLEKLIRTLAISVFGDQKLLLNQEYIDISKPFTKMSMKDAICYYQNIDIHNLEDLYLITKLAKSINIKINKHWSIGHIQSEIFDKTVTHNLIKPIFITDYPIEVSPLARKNDYNHNIADRFELFIGGYEISNGFSELNDAEEQKIRFAQQHIINKNCNNQDYITALEHGLPPTAGLGIGIDRLVMLLTNSKNIRDVILFPTLKNQT